MKRSPRKAVCLLVSFLLISFLLTSCRAATSRYEAEGIVEELQLDYGRYGQVVIAHEDIPGLMPAMTMNFDVASPALLEGLAPGQRIRFELEYDRRSYRVTAVEVLEGAGDGARSSRQRLANLAAQAGPAPAFRLVDQAGQPLSDADLRGKAVLVDFVYTRCPGPCPVITGRHVSVWRKLSETARSGSRFVSISLDPEYDTPEALAAYARARGADVPGWSFLTGPPERVDAVLAAWGVGRVRQPNDEIDHLVATFLVDARGRIVRRYVGLDHTAEAIAGDLESLAGS